MVGAFLTQTQNLASLLSIGLLVIFISAAAYGYRQATRQAERLPAPYPRRWQQETLWTRKRQ